LAQIATDFCKARIDFFFAGDVNFREATAEFFCNGFAALFVQVKNTDPYAFSAKLRAVASPRPDAPPVIMAVMFESSFMSTLPFKRILMLGRLYAPAKPLASMFI
jgi:hypothetical protein